VATLGASRAAELEAALAGVGAERSTPAVPQRVRRPGPGRADVSSRLLGAASWAPARSWPTRSPTTRTWPTACWSAPRRWTTSAEIAGLRGRAFRGPRALGYPPRRCRHERGSGEKLQPTLFERGRPGTAAAARSRTPAPGCPSTASRPRPTDRSRPALPSCNEPGRRPPLRQPARSSTTLSTPGSIRSARAR
jgi:hypothetical protein